ncbi:MAG TPA: phage minor head protein [Usitatibacteraceae bacterium]
MPEPVNLSFAFNLKPAEVLAYLRKKGYLLPDAWLALAAEDRARAFTVANVAKADVLLDIRNELLRTIESGTGYEGFLKALMPRLKAKGWWGIEETIDEETGEVTSKTLGSPWRLETIYRTNVQTARMAGRFKQMLANASNRPFWQYNGILDQHTRPYHAALQGKVFRYDDPIWDVIYPPNGFNCRCFVFAMNQRDLDRLGLKVTSSAGLLNIETVETANGEQTVATVRVAQAVGRDKMFRTDPGFANNPGKVFWPDDELPAKEAELGV